MSKGKAKINSSEDSAPPQLRSLRSRKREHPNDGISQTDHVPALHQQDTAGNHTAVVATLLPSPLQECAVITNQQDQAAEQSCLTKQEDATVKHAEVTNETTNVTVTELEATTVTSPNNESPTHDETSGKDKTEIVSEECNKSPHQTCTDQLQVFLPISEDRDGSCATGSEKQLGAKDNSQCNLERNQETSQDKPSNMCTSDVKEVTKESAAGLPAKKKRRMGMCGLTEKERTHFLLTQRHENGQMGIQRAEKLICKNPADPVALEESMSSPPLPSSSLSIPADHRAEQSEAEPLKLQFSHCGGHDSAETEVHVAVTASGRTSAVSDPGCSEGKSCEAEGAIVPGPEQTGTPESRQLAEEEEGEHLENQELQELTGQTAEIMAEMPEEEDGSTEADCGSDIAGRNEESDSQDVVEAALHEVNSVTTTRDEKKEEMAGDVVGGEGADAGASSTDTQSGGLSCGSEGLCEAAVTPSVSDRKDGCDPDDEPAAGPSTVNAEHAQTRDPVDPFGSECLYYVSDSQLNTIALIDEEELEKEEEPDSSDCHEDATDLICGLIRELSSLNRKVMATHRELENLRRSGKHSRSSLH